MALHDDVRSLAANPILGTLDADALRLIAFAAESRIMRGGDLLFTAGDASDGGFVLLSGAVLLTTKEGSVRVRPPALIGANALILETQRPCTARVEEPSSVLVITRALFHRVLSEHPGSAARLRRALAERLNEIGAELGQFAG
jgi:CRP-like cAMP-binding protein